MKLKKQYLRSNECKINVRARINYWCPCQSWYQTCIPELLYIVVLSKRNLCSLVKHYVKASLKLKKGMWIGAPVVFCLTKPLRNTQTPFLLFTFFISPQSVVHSSAVIPLKTTATEYAYKQTQWQTPLKPSNQWGADLVEGGSRGFSKGLSSITAMNWSRDIKTTTYFLCDWNK